LQEKGKDEKSARSILYPTNYQLCTKMRTAE